MDHCRGHTYIHSRYVRTNVQKPWLDTAYYGYLISRNEMHCPLIPASRHARLDTVAEAQAQRQGIGVRIGPGWAKVKKFCQISPRTFPFAPCRSNLSELINVREDGIRQATGAVLNLRSGLHRAGSQTSIASKEPQSRTEGLASAVEEPWSKICG